jgi:hypothetical protein
MSNSNYPNAQNQPAGAIPVYTTGMAYKNITAAANTLVKTGAGTLDALIIGTGGAGSSAIIYDGTDATGTVIGTVSTAAAGYLPFNIIFHTGLFIATSGGTAANITVAYQ